MIPRFNKPYPVTNIKTTVTTLTNNVMNVI